MSGMGNKVRRVVEAAGGILYRWRETPPNASDSPEHDLDNLQVCIVHRPKYDDWSWPKGKMSWPCPKKSSSAFLLLMTKAPRRWVDAGYLCFCTKD